eukprot:jgi/Orpsp1_1/1181016/evm.model.c7180000075530.1
MLNVNEKDNNGNSLLFKSVENNNIEMINLLIEFAYKNNTILNVNELNKIGNSPLSRSIDINMDITMLLINYSNKNNIILNEDEKYHIENYLNKLLLKCFDENNIEYIESIFRYSNKNNIILNINENFEYKWSPLIYSVQYDNIELMMILIDYAKERNIILNLNEKYNSGDYPLLKSITNNNTEIFQLLLNYAIEKNIILNLNDKNNNEEYPLLSSVVRNNYEISKLLINYANKYNIKMEISYENIEIIISKNFKNIVKNVSAIHKEIFDLLFEHFPYFKSNKDKFINDLKKHTENYSNTITTNELIYENNFEWNIDPWDKVKDNNMYVLPNFKIDKTNWKIQLNPKGNYNSENNNVSIYLYNEDVSNNSNQYIYCIYTLYLRKYSDYSFDNLIEKNDYNYLYIKNNNKCGSDNFIKLSDLNSSVQYNILVLGINFRIYKYNKEELEAKFINDLTSYTENISNMITNNELIHENNFEWDIDNWNGVKNDNLYVTPSFKIGNTTWNIHLYPKGSNRTNNNKVSIYLYNEDVENNKLQYVYCIYTLYLRRYNEYSFSKVIGKQDFEYLFFNNKNSWGEGKFINSSSVDSLKYNTLVLGINLRIYKLENYQLKEKFQSIMKDSNPQLESIDYINNEYYEWDIADWEKMKTNNNEIEYSPEFTIDDIKWNIGLSINKSNNYIYLNLNNLSSLENGKYKNYDIHSNYVFFIRNKNSFNLYFKNHSNITVFNSNNSHSEMSEFIKEEDLSNKDLIEDNHVKIGVYICIYKKERILRFIDKLRLSIEEETSFDNNDDGDDIVNVDNNISKDNYFEVEIDQWNEKIGTDNPIITSFTVGGYCWECILHSKNDDEKNMNYLSFYLK